MLWILIILTAFFPILYYYFMLFQQDRTFDAAQAFTFHLKNCEIIYVSDPSRNPQRPYFEIEVPGRYPFTYDAKVQTSQAGGTVITAKSPHGFVNACFIRIHYHADTVWGGDLSVMCEGHCHIRQRSIEAIALASGRSLSVNGEWIDINFPNIVAHSINVQTSEGELYFNSASLSADSLIATEKGDVVFQSPNDFNAAWTDHTNYYCLGGSSGASITAMSGPTNCYDTQANNANAQSTSCSATYSICKSVCSGSRPTVTLKASHGSIYANVIQGTGQILETNAEVVKSQLYDGTIAAQSIFDESLINANSQFNDTSKGDKIEIIQIGNVNARSTQSVRLVVSPNDAYIEAGPWWITVFSSQMLLGLPRAHSGRLAPGFCPFRPEINTSQLNQVQNLISSYFQDIPSHFGYIEASQAQPVSASFPSTSTGYLQSLKRRQDEILRRSLDQQGQLLVSKISISQNTQLEAAIVISIIISAILAVSGVVLSVYALNQAFTHFASDSDHIRKYAKRYNKLAKLVQPITLSSLSTSGPVIGKKPGILRKKTRILPYERVPDEESLHSRNVSSLDFLSTRDMQEERSHDETLKIEKEEGDLKKKKEKENKFSTTLKNLPPPFAIIDHIMFLVKRALTNSFRQFLSEYFIEIKQDQLANSPNSVALIELELQYERFCFLKHYSEREINTAKGNNKIQKYGFNLVQKRSNLTEVFKRLKLLSEQEIENRKLKWASEHFSDEQSSIEHFLNSECVVTQFDSDVVMVNTFKQRYEKFCEVHRLSQVLVTRQLMSNYGIESIKLDQTFIQRKAVGLDDERVAGFDNKCMRCCLKCCTKRRKYYGINPQGMEDKLNNLIIKYLKEHGHYSAKIKRQSPFTRCWCLYDFFSVFLHILTILLFTFIPLAFLLFQELVFGVYQSTVYQDKIQLEDFTVAPWNLPLKVPIFSVWNIFLFSLAAMNLCFSVAQLIRYYSQISFPLDTLEHFQKRTFAAPKHCFRITMESIIWIYVFLIIGMLSGYISLILIWAILGAILNPTAYLYYATSAVTLVGFVSIKIREYQKMQERGIEYLMEVIDSKLKEVIDVVLKRMLQSLDFLPEQAQGALQEAYDIVKDPKAALEDRLIGFVSHTLIGKKITAAGFDVKMLIHIARGNTDQLLEFALQRGMPRPIALGLIALLKGDTDAVVANLKDLTSHPAIRVPPALMDTFVSIILNPSEVNVKNTVNTLSLNLFDLLKARLPGERMPHLEQCRAIFPLMFQVLWELKSGHFDTSLDLLMKLNRMLYNAVDKKVSFEHNFLLREINPEDYAPGALNQKFLQQQKWHISRYDQLFTEDNFPKFCLPLYYFSILELLKIPLAVSSNLPLNFERLRQAGFNLLRHFAGVERVILDFFSMIFTLSKDKLIPSNSSLALTRKQQHKILHQVGLLFKIPPYLLKSLFKFAFRDKTFDAQFFQDIAQIVSEVSGIQIHRAFVEIAFGLYTLLSTKNIKKSLSKMANRFGVDPHTAKAFLRISSKVEFSSEGWTKFMTSELMMVVAKSLRISKNEVVGIISMLMGDMLNFNIEEILSNFCIRHDLHSEVVYPLKSLMDLIMSDNCEAVLNALKRLNIQDQWIALVAKKMVHPKFIDVQDFLNLDIDSEEKFVEARDKLDIEDDEKFHNWIRNFSRSLASQESNLKKAEYQKRQKELQARAKSLFKERKLKGQALYSKLEEVNSFAFDQFPDKVDDLGNELSIELKLEKSDTHRKQMAQKLLNLRSLPINGQFVKTLFKKVNVHKPITDEQFEKIAKLLSIKDIVSNENKNLVNSAINNIANLFGYERKTLRCLVDIVTAGNTGEIELSLRNLFQQKVELSDKEMNLAEFAKVASEELSAVHLLERVSTLLSNVLGFPKFIISRLIAPFLRESVQLSINDVCFLFDMIGFNESHFKLTDHRANIGVSKFRYVVANLVIGNIPNLKELGKIFNIDENLLQLMEAITISRPRLTLVLLIDIFKKINKEKFKIPSRVFDFFMAFFAFFKGQGSRVSFNQPLQLIPKQAKQGYEQKIVNTHEFLGSIFDIFPDFFKALEYAMKGEVKQLPHMLERLMYRSQELGREVLEPPLVKGILSVFSGKIITTQDLAEKLGVSPDLLDICIMLSRIANSQKNVKKSIDDLKASNSFRPFCSHLKVDMNIFLNLLKLTENAVSPTTFNEVLISMGIQNFCNLNNLHSILAICKGNINMDIFDRKGIELATKIREENLDELKSFILTLTNALKLDSELTIIALRLTQGDWQIIEDYELYLAPFLPTRKFRNVVMGLCGVIRSPIAFHTDFYDYPSKFKHPVNYEGAIELLGQHFHMNPLVLRLASFDEELLQLIEDKFHFPRQCLVSILISLCNLKRDVIKFIIQREFRRKFQMMKERNNSLLKDLKHDEREKKKEGGSQKRKGKEELSKLYKHFKKNKIPRSEEEGVSQTSYMKEVCDDFETIFDRLDFESEKYDEECQNFKTMQDVGHQEWREEFFEMVLFNGGDFIVSQRYEEVKNEEKRRRAFKLSEKRCAELLGNEDDWNRAMATKFFKRKKSEFRSKKERLEFAEEFNKFKKTWLSKEDRNQAENIWALFKQLLSQLSQDKRITNSKEWDYDRISLAQLVVGLTLLGIRREVEHSSWVCSPDQYSSLCFDLDFVLLYVELDGLLTGKLSRHFYKISVIKTLGMCLNIRFSNVLERELTPSLMRKDILTVFEDKFKHAFYHLPHTVDEVERFNRTYDEFAQFLENQGVFSSIDWFSLFMALHNIEMDSQQIQVFYPYDRRDVQKLADKALERFPYFAEEDEELVEQKQALMVKPLAFQDITDPSFEEIDLLSKQPLSQVMTLLSNIERTTVANHQPLSFILGLGRNEGAVWQDFKELLLSAEIAKNQNSLPVYKSILALINLSKTTRELLARKAQNVEAPSIRMLLSASNINVDHAILEDLIMLAHGNYESSHFSSIASRFHTDPMLIRTFFISAKPASFLKNPHQVRQFIRPITDRLKIDSEVLLSLFKIYNGDLGGWLQLASYLSWSHSKENIQEFLKVVNPYKLSRMTHYQTEQKKTIFLLKDTFPETLFKIGKSIALSQKVKGRLEWLEQKDQIERGFKMMKAIHSREVIQALDHFAYIKHLFDLGEKNTENHLFEPLVVLINFKFLFFKNHFNKEETKEFLQFVSSSLLGEDEAAEEMKLKFASVLYIVLGAISSDWSLLEEGIAKIHKGFVIVLNIFRVFSKMRSFEKIKIRHLLQYNIPAANKVRQAIKALMDIMVKAANFLGKGDAAKQDDLKSSSYLHSDGGVDAFQKKSEHIMEWMDSIVDHLESGFEDIRDIIEAEEKDVFAQMVNENKREPGADSDRDNYELIMEAIMTGNIHQFLELVQKNQVEDERLKGLIRMVLAGYDIIRLNRYSFQEVAEKALKDDNQNEIDTFAGQISQLLQELIGERLNSSKPRQPRQIKALQQCQQVVGDKFILSRIIFTLLALRFNKLNKSFALAYLIQLIQAVFKKAEHKIPDQLIIALFGCLPSDMVNANPHKKSRVQRLELLLDFLLQYFLPDFINFKPLLQRLGRLITELFTLNSYHDIGSVLHRNVDNLGHLFGVNPELLEGLIGILRGDYYALARMAAPLADINPELITKLIDFIGDVKNLVDDFTRRRSLLSEKRERRGELKDDLWRDLRQKISDGKASNRELFYLTDQEGDGNGKISKDEFRTMIWRLQIKVSEHRIDQIFAASQQKLDDSEDEKGEELNEREFEEAIKYIGVKTSMSALEILGISTTQLVLIFSVLLSVLLLTFVFLFLGIQAFSIGGTFGSIINSILPITAGVIVGKKKDVNEKAEHKKADQAYEKVETILQIEQ